MSDDVHPGPRPDPALSADDIAGAHESVSFLELFFDLVWVFAVSQLSGHLVEDLSWRGAAETVVMAMAMFTIWSFSMIESTMVLARREGAGWIILATMAGGLVMNASIPSAFDDGAWGFVVPMILIQVGRFLATRHYDVYPELRDHRLAMAAWALLSAVPWVGGALAEPHARVWWWALAVAIDLVGARTKHPVPWIRSADFSSTRLDVDHQVERTNLFLIICLGESILTTGSALAEGPTEPVRLLTALCSLAVVVSLWSIFFGSHAIEVGRRRLERAGSDIDIDIANIGINWQGLLLLAIVAFAVAAEEIVGDPEAPLELAVAACLALGPAACLVARGLYLGPATDTAGYRPLLLGAAALVLLLVAAGVGEIHSGAAMAGAAAICAAAAIAHHRALA